MSRPKVRLFVDAAFVEDGQLDLEKDQTHYLVNVMRLKLGDELAVFNGEDGEWIAVVDHAGKRGATLRLVEQVREQETSPDLWLLFAPIKKDRFDFIIEKATELGVSGLWPVVTERCVMSRVNMQRLQLNVIEAAEQCERLDLPEVFEPKNLDRVFAKWPKDRQVLVLDEHGAADPIGKVLDAQAQEDHIPPYAILVGPEGGFSKRELDGLGKLPFVTRVSLGPRILRADTAAAAALSCWQAVLGDWRERTASRF